MSHGGFPEGLRPQLARLTRMGLIAGAGGAAIALGLAVVWPDAILPAYLTAFLYFLGLALGCSSFLMLHKLTGGGWGVAIRRPLEAGAMTILPLAVLFLPIVIGAAALYPWVQPSAHLAEAIAHKRGYLNLNAFVGRAVFYFAVWIGLAVALNRLSMAEDATDDPGPTRWLQRLSGPGLLLLFACSSFAVIDWVMSLEPEWYSTIFPAMVIVGWGLTTFAVMTFVVILLIPYESVPDVVTPPRLHDLGNLILAFVMLWAYLSFSQYLIIWAGELAEEIPWYLRRNGGGWEWVVRILMLFHFFVPFAVLLFRESKRKAEYLKLLVGWIAVIHLIDLAWLVLPAGIEDPLNPHLTWGGILALPICVLGVGGLWLASFLWFLGRKPLLPVHLPELGHPHAGAPSAATSGGH